MNMSSLPPPHPSLPQPPIGSQLQSFQPSTSYGYHSPASYTYSAHYAQAYYAQLAPQSASATGLNTSSVATNAIKRGKGTPVHLMSTWYQAGNVRCSYPGCTFQGSHKSVEVHKMDRHLIYPPDWEKRKKAAEWDADPSLKGKPIPIQGINVTLDTPELIDAWITERKKRFPTFVRVEEKRRKAAEAIERGQLDFDPSRPARLSKRQKIDPANGQGSHIQASRRRTMQGKRPDFSKRGWKHRQKPLPEANAAPAVPSFPEHDDDKESDDDTAPEELSSKPPDSVESVHSDQTVSLVPPICSQPARPQERRRLKEPQPRGPPRNPFASRPALLRNLLLPEIRMTVSNLSQAIHFLVDNDFLRQVELKPGQAAEQQKIHVVSSQESNIN